GRPKKPETTAKELKTARKTSLKNLPPLSIIFENDDVLVVDKPAGMLTHPTDVSSVPTLMDAAIAHDKRIARAGNDPHRAGIVHRLDKDASGIVIIAKNNASLEHLKQQFRERRVEKHYHVLVSGRLEKETDTLTRRIARSKKNGRMVARPTSQEGKEAITHYDVRTRFANATELSVRLETGRTHQIRVHLHALGHPVVGDTLYTIKNQKQIPLSRLWLHAEALTITLPDESEPRTFTSPLPDALTQLIHTLHVL
ncbi:RluA family pseudouridine synthase, partial [Candidatus Uhrbacteria bacterium]|nr:RluA family pseudouridine synthase [Candidatus Uhrbacteria bacterium]